MQWDAEAMFSNKQTVTANANSTNVVAVPPNDSGKGRPLWLSVFGGGYTGSGTLAVELQTADDAAMATPLTIATYTITNANILKGGPLLAAALPTGCRKYLRLNYNVTGTLSGGALTSGLVLEAQTNE